MEKVDARRGLRATRSMRTGCSALCGLLATACDRGDHPARIGARAPEFTVSDGTQTVDLAKLRGHIGGAELLGDMVHSVH